MILNHQTKLAHAGRTSIVTTWQGIEVAYCEVIDKHTFVELEGFTTFDSYRFNGIGKAVIEFILSTFQKDILAYCYKTNDACLFYRKVGFTCDSQCEEFMHFVRRYADNN